MKNLQLFLFAVVLLASCGSESLEVLDNSPDFVKDFKVFETDNFQLSIKAEPEVMADEEIFTEAGTAFKTTYLMESNDSSAQFICHYQALEDGGVLSDIDCKEDVKESFLIQKFMSLPYIMLYDYDTDIRYGVSRVTGWTYYYLNTTPYSSANEFYLLVYGVENETDSLDHIAEANYFFENFELKETELMDEIE